jgi:hypothetical protein
MSSLNQSVSSHVISEPRTTISQLMRALSLDGMADAWEQTARECAFETQLRALLEAECNARLNESTPRRAVLRRLRSRLQTRGEGGAMQLDEGASLEFPLCRWVIEFDR